MQYVLQYILSMSDAFAWRVKLKYHATFNGIQRCHGLGNPRHQPTGYHETRGFPFRDFFFIFLPLFPPHDHTHAAYYLSRSDPGRVVDQKKRVSRCNVIGEEYVSFIGSEMSRSNKTSGYIVGDVLELLLERN